MNLAQLKNLLEQNIIEALKGSMDGGIDVNAIYDINNARLIAELKQPKEVDEGKSSILYYQIQYFENEKTLSIIAFNRVFYLDVLGVRTVDVEPVAVSESFMKDIKMIIEYGIDKTYNPGKYEIPEAEVVMETVEEETEVKAE